MSSKNKKTKSKLRTVNVSTDGGPPHAMTPEAAAKYLQQHVSTNSTSANNNNNKNNKSTNDVKISFGPSRPPGGLSLGSLDLNALKETAAAAQRGSFNADGLPCSEAEMKALMGMFVEIMGMSMDGNKPQSSSSTNSSKTTTTTTTTTTTAMDSNTPMFKLGATLPNGSSWPDPETLTAATAGFFADGASWEALRRTYGAVYNSAVAFSTECDDDDDDDDDEDDDDDNESLPDLDDMRDILERRAQVSAGDWPSLQKLAVHDALQEEERARKLAKKREKKLRRKQKQKEEAVAKAAEAAHKKREKTILSWRSRVVSACQAGELSKLDALLQESPLSAKAATEKDEFYVIPHLEFLLPNSIAKNRNQVERGKETRHRLAHFLLSEEVQLAFIPMRSGRSPIHTACFQGDVAFVELVLQHLERHLLEHPKDTYVSRDDLNVTCEDSGWTALHYAAVSGSAEVLELMLRSGCDVKAITDDTHTWRHSDGQGITPRELIEHIKAGTFDDEIESHGVALQEMQNSFFGNQTDRRAYLKTLEATLRRLKDVETNGYIAPGLLEPPTSSSIDDSNSGQGDNHGHSDSAAKRRKKKKRKKKGTAKDTEESEEDDQPAAVGVLPPTSVRKEEVTEEFKDPLVIALLGMGFTNDQISAAVRACGGTARATADDLVTWILGQDADGGTVEESPSTATKHTNVQAGEIEITEKTVTKSKQAEDNSAGVDKREPSESAAKRLAEKREEQRRRYREWNNREQARQAQSKYLQQAPPGHFQSPPSYATPTTAPGASNVSNLKTAIPEKPTTVASLQTDPLPVNVPSLLTQANQIASTNDKATIAPSSTARNHPANKPSPIAALETDFPALSQTVSAPNPPTTKKVVRVPTMAPGPTQVMTAQNSFPAIGDDERTVSSFGSNRGLSVSSGPYLPPGIATSLPLPVAQPVSLPSFMQPAIEPSLKEVTSVSTDLPFDSTQSGSIRATAKEFIPKSYTPSGATLPQLSLPKSHNSRPPLSSHYVPGFGAPMRVSLTQGPPSFDNGTIPLSEGFLATGAPLQPLSSAFLGVESTMHDRIPAVTPLSEDASTATPSIGSSLTGIPGLDDSTLSSGLGPLVVNLEHQSALDNTVSLLSSAFTSGPALGVSSLWGSETTSQATTPLLGLPLAFTNDTGASSKEEGKFGDDLLPFNWGAPGMSGGGGLSGAQGGSIW